MRKKKSSNRTSNRTRHFPGDRRPAKDISKHKMSYEVKLSKYEGQMRWLVIERPTGSILCISTFEDKARNLAAFHNKHKIWVPQGGVVKYLTLGTI
tara:strand:- start:62 stop:349 length:288 start_codon:yes stop_codon:yes gene_type:complete